MGVGVHHTSLVVVVRWKLGDEMEKRGEIATRKACSCATTVG